MAERKLLDFYADWCGPCKFMKPIVEEAELRLLGKLKIEKVNVDNDLQKATKFNIQGIPAFVALQDDIELDRLVGGVNKKTFNDFLNKTFNNFQP